jgi:hypothetical protein
MAANLYPAGDMRQNITMSGSYPETKPAKILEKPKRTVEAVRAYMAWRKTVGLKPLQLYVARSRMEGDKPYAKYLAKERVRNKELLKKAEAVEKEERTYRRRQKDELNKTLATAKKDVIADVDKFLADDMNVPAEFIGEKGIVDKKKLKAFRNNLINEKYKEIAEIYTSQMEQPQAPLEATAQLEQAPTPKRPSGGSIVTDDGTIAVTGGEYGDKQFIFRPVDDFTKDEPYTGRYSVSRSVPGKNKFEEGGEISAGDLYKKTKGAFGEKGALDDNRGEEAVSADDMRFGQSVQPNLAVRPPSNRIEQYNAPPTVTPETDPYLFDEVVDETGGEPALAPTKVLKEQQSEKMLNAKRDGQDDYIKRMWGKMAPTFQRGRDVYEKLPDMSREGVPVERMPEEIRVEPGGEPMDKEAFVGGNSTPMMPQGGINPREEIGPAVSGFENMQLAPKGDGWDDAKTATGMNLEQAQADAAVDFFSEFGYYPSTDDLGDYVEWRTRGKFDDSRALTSPSADYME